MPQEDEFFVGEEMSESDFGRRRRHYPWEKILNAIGPGKVREMSMSHSTIAHALDDLVKRGKIKKDEFYMITKGGKGKRRVFIAHRGKKTA